MRISRPFRDWSSWPIVPSTGSALYLRSHPAQLVCAEPYWAIIRSSLRDFALQTAVTNVETLLYGTKAVPSREVSFSAAFGAAVGPSLGSLGLVLVIL
jgi:hypothetical protein